MILILDVSNIFLIKQMIMLARIGKKMLLAEKSFLSRKSKRYMGKYFLMIV